MDHEVMLMPEKIILRTIEDDLRESYLDYAMSVIIGRAIPDARDGLKPVHRRIMFAMHEMGNTFDKPHKKSARAVGETLGKFHPHGDVAIYDALIRMAQDFSLRYPLVHGQGNMGCFTKDTKVRLTDGRSLSFEELIKEDSAGKENYTFAMNNKTGKIEIARIQKPRLTLKNANIMKVVLDNGEKIRCTLNHRFMLRNGEYKEAQNLQPGDSLMPLYARFATKEVTKTEILEETEDVYDLTIDDVHNFALNAGVFVHNSIDGDSPASMRYTEVRLAKMADDILADLEKETVDWMDNFDGTLKEPMVMPSKIPNLLINGSSGIAVGMATNMPPHNLTEIVDGTIAVIDGADESKLLAMVSGPDFPTGGEIVGRAGIAQAYKTGRGIIRIRGKAHVDAKRNAIVITEIPYQVTKTAIIESIAEAVKNKKIEGISGIHDRSDKDGIEVLVDLKRGAIGEVVLNQIYAHTPMEGTFGIINLVLVGKQPKVLGLYPLINEFIEFRKEVVRRRCAFELRQAEERAHILEGLKVALENIDEIVTYLKRMKDIAEARMGLMKKYSLSEKQANAILDMKISRLVALERKKIEDEHAELVKAIAWLKDVLSDVNRILKIIKDELLEVKDKYGDGRRTTIIEAEGEITDESLIPNEQVVVPISGRGYVKRVGLDEYRTQHRGGKGVMGAETKEQDFVQDVIVVRNHNYILFFTDKGRVFWLKAYQIPEAGRYAAGKSLVNLLDLKEEKVTSWIPVPEFKPDEYLVMVTKNGIVKRTSLDDFSHPRKNGIIAITLRDGDGLVEVIKTDGKEELLIATKQGQAIRFDENNAREIGRSGMGVIGIRLKGKDDAVVGVASCKKYPSVLTMTENGYGKRTATDEYRLQGRGGSGVINMKTEGRNGAVIGVRGVFDTDEVIVISSKGQTIRSPVTDISVIGRNTQGVRIIRLQEEEGEKVASFAVVPKEEKTEEVKTTA